MSRGERSDRSPGAHPSINDGIIQKPPRREGRTKSPRAKVWRENLIQAASRHESRAANVVENNTGVTEAAR